jgi:hypothetical protein
MFYYSRLLNSGRCFLLLLVVSATLLIADGQQQHNNNNNNRSTLLRSMSQVRSAPATTSSSKTVRQEVMRQPFVSILFLINPKLYKSVCRKNLAIDSRWRRQISAGAAASRSNFNSGFGTTSNTHNSAGGST